MECFLILGVGLNVTREEVFEAFQLKKASWNPDNFPVDQKELAGQRIAQINHAYECIMIYLDRSARLVNELNSTRLPVDRNNLVANMSGDR